MQINQESIPTLRAMDNDTILSDKLHIWNSKLARGPTPNSVILSLYIITGLLGNSTVIVIYGFKMKGNKKERYFIPFLATADLLASLVCGSFGIALNMMQAQFNNNRLCKAWWFFAAFTTSCSFFLLLVIAAQRYLKICRPLQRQMTLKWKRFGIILVLIIGFILSTPTTHFYGSVSFPNEEEGIVGLRCSKLKSENKTESLIFGGIVLLTAIFVIISLICLYTRIGYTIIRHLKYEKKTTKQESNTTVEKPSQSYISQVQHFSKDGYLRNTNTECQSVKTNEFELSVIVNCTKNTKLNKWDEHKENKFYDAKPAPFKSSAKRRKEQINKRVVHKFTFMFMLSTIIFLICYIPKVVIILLEARNPRFWEEFSDSGRAGMLFVYRMYIINNITNPIIFAFLDSQFRGEFKKLFKNCCSVNVSFVI